uniref:NADH-ubiquinone oxidoreductase chain 4L n=1 Tax=Sipunculus nudus TaxID=6446 RepID=B8XR41_SIPNU|nr:NADH dehydrogenase subunit 4L [Sipunculus nudus]ACJ11899.1 NADH dehydrogenase subunit 4L [Sipunculus nudus]
MLSLISIIAPLPVLTLFTFMLTRKQLLMALLSLEATMLALTLLLAHTSPSHTLSIITLLTMAACEASVGLAVLVLMTRTAGSDTLTSLNLNKW